MYKNTHRLFSTLSKHVHNGVILSTTSFVNNNNCLMTTPAITRISLSALTCNIKKCFCTKTFNSLENDDSDTNVNNPSVVMQKQIQAEAQTKLDELFESDVERKKFYNVIQLEIDLLRQSGGKVPSQLRPTEWLQMMNIHSQNRRKNYLEFLWINEIKRLNTKLRKKENLLLKKSVEEREKEEEEKNGHLKYGLNNNTMFHRIYNNKMTLFHNSKLINAMIYGEKLVMDFGFESQMTSSEISSCAKQFMHAFSINRENIDPYDILLCNVNLNGELIRRIRSFIPTMEDPGYPIHITPKSYLEVFPKEDLIYLTPHTNQVLHKFVPNKVYIIGGIVDKAHSKPTTLAKAKEEGIQVAKFPLDSYVDFQSGSNKVLNINHCLEIMLSIKNTNSWEEAFKCIPTRKLVKPYSDYKSGKVIREIRNVEPKFRSGHASHLSDAAYNKLKSLKFNEK